MDYVLSVDLGDEDVTPSSTVRFYAIREHYHIVDIDRLEEYSQPLLILQIWTNC